VAKERPHGFGERQNRASWGLLDEDVSGIRVLEGGDREAILKSRYAGGPRPDNLLVIQARQRFPNQARVTLIWGKGVVSQAGVETGQDQALPFEVRETFTLTFSCLRENPKAQCVPVAPMYLGIQAVIAKSFARIHRSNLINFGILPLLFNSAEDYEKTEQGDRLIIEGIKNSLAVNRNIIVFNRTKNYSFEVASGLNDREKEIILSGGLLPNTKKKVTG